MRGTAQTVPFLKVGLLCCSVGGLGRGRAVESTNVSDPNNCGSVAMSLSMIAGPPVARRVGRSAES